MLVQEAIMEEIEANRAKTFIHNTLKPSESTAGLLKFGTLMYFYAYSSN